MSISKDKIFPSAASITTRQQRRSAERRQKSFTHEQLNDAIIRAEQVDQPGWAELIREVRKGCLTLVCVPNRAVKLPDLNAAPAPTIVLIGDDDYFSTGPGGWACSPTIAAWAGCAVIHAAGTSVETYRQAIHGAHARGRAVLVETDAANAEPWAELFRPMPTLLVLPHDGVHPILPDRGSIH